MKKICYLLIASAVISCVNPQATPKSNAAANQNPISSFVPEEANASIQDNYEDILTVSYEYHDQMAGTDIDDYQIEEPFVIYNMDAETWNEVYYYPLSYEDEIMLVASVINTTYGWTVSASDNYIDYLNQIDYLINPSYLFYLKNDELISVSISGEEDLVGTVENCQVQLENDDYVQSLYQELKCEIISKIDEMEPVDINKLKQINTQESLFSYTSSYVYNMTDGKICSLFNAQGQGNYNICWAASAATIINYRFGTDYTATEICDRMNLPYEGAEVSTIKRTLDYHLLHYTIRGKQLSWSSIKSNIDNKYPILMCAAADDLRYHATVVFGYIDQSQNDYIIMFNPADKTTSTIIYDSEFTVYVSNSYDWCWCNSLSAK